MHALSESNVSVQLLQSFLFSPILKQQIQCKVSSDSLFEGLRKVFIMTFVVDSQLLSIAYVSASRICPERGHYNTLSN